VSQRPGLAARAFVDEACARTVAHTFASPSAVRQIVDSLNAVPLLHPVVGTPCFSNAALKGFRLALLSPGRAAPVAVATWVGCGNVALDIGGNRYFLWLDTGETAGNRLAEAFITGSLP